jgi:hypothetical protein
MSATIEEILSQDLYGALFEPYGSASLSTKPWTSSFDPITAYRAYLPTKTNLNIMFHELETDDSVRLAKSCFYINDTMEVHRSEGDTVASWHMQVAHPVSLAFQEHPCLIRRLESSPPGSESDNVIVDFYLSLLYNKSEHCVISGELKRWGIIIPQQWRGGDQSSISKRLGKELRG